MISFFNFRIMRCNVLDLHFCLYNWVVKVLTLSLSILLIHLRAWPWGSIISGQRRPRVTSTPFSVEKPSLGSPCIFHSLTAVGFAMNSQKLMFSLHGTPLFLTLKVDVTNCKHSCEQVIKPMLAQHCARIPASNEWKIETINSAEDGLIKNHGYYSMSWRTWKVSTRCIIMYRNFSGTLYFTSGIQLLLTISSL